MRSRRLLIPALAAVALVIASCSSATTTDHATTSTAASSAPTSSPGGSPTWTVAQSGSSALIGWLDGVDCITSTSCVAVGNEMTSARPPGKALVETLDHGSWTPATVPAAPGSDGNYLFSVSCPSAGSCVAVGYYFTQVNGGGKGSALIETLANGTWSVTPTPKLTGGITDSFLTGVSCTAPTECVAVGDVDDGDATTSLPVLLTMTGGVWSITAIPSLGPQRGGLLGVSCSNPAACVAVGYTTTAGATKTLVESRTGGTWSIAASPGSGGATPDYGARGLTSISCTNQPTCVAVGQLTRTGPVIEGSSSQQSSSIASPNPAPQDKATGLYGVSCSTAPICVAVGDLAKQFNSDAPNGAFGLPLGPLIETSTGGPWQVNADPVGLPADSGLHDVSCVGPMCVAVGQTGQFSTPMSTVKTLIVQTK